jgi:hypothetical protein
LGRSGPSLPLSGSLSPCCAFNRIPDCLQGGNGFKPIQRIRLGDFPFGQAAGKVLQVIGKFTGMVVDALKLEVVVDIFKIGFQFLVFAGVFLQGLPLGIMGDEGAFGAVQRNLNPDAVLVNTRPIRPFSNLKVKKYR